MKAKLTINTSIRNRAKTESSLGTMADTKDSIDTSILGGETPHTRSTLGTIADIEKETEDYSKDTLIMGVKTIHQRGTLSTVADMETIDESAVPSADLSFLSETSTKASQYDGSSEDTEYEVPSRHPTDRAVRTAGTVNTSTDDEQLGVSRKGASKQSTIGGKTKKMKKLREVIDEEMDTDSDSMIP